MGIYITQTTKNKIILVNRFFEDKNMNDNIDWRNIRTINHTQQDGFEELVCQIARKEKGNNYKRFCTIRFERWRFRMLLGINR